MVLEIFIISKLIQGYKSLNIKNKDSFVKVDWLLLAANLAITSFSN